MPETRTDTVPLRARREHAGRSRPIGAGPEGPRRRAVPPRTSRRLREQAAAGRGGIRAHGSALARAVKRAVDIAGALCGLILLLPLFAVLGLLVLITSGRPVFFLQERVGLGGRPFLMYKFRSMKRNAERETGPIWASAEDVRCTPFGAWLRRTNLDELPQLINVLAGEMSLVGPRPERPMFVAQFTREHVDYPLRHTVPVGMTGWAQIHGWRGRTSLRRRLDCDLEYVRRWSLGLDLLVLWRTAQHVLWGKTDWPTPGPASGRERERLEPGHERLRREVGRRDAHPDLVGEQGDR